MIPTHLQGKNAEEIVQKMENRIYSSNSTSPFSDYTEKLHILLLLAVKDALMNANYEDSLSALEAEQRAIAFLNKVLPKE